MDIFLSDNNLLDHLSNLFHQKPENIQLFSRQHSIYSSTFPSEIIKCKIDNRNYSFLFKYLDGIDNTFFGHRGAVTYEAQVYKEILRSIPLTTPAFYGLCKQGNTDNVLMVIEYLENAELLYRSAAQDQFEKTVKWIAEFHELFKHDQPDFLIRYTAAYYFIWAKQSG